MFLQAALVALVACSAVGARHGDASPAAAAAAAASPPNIVFILTDDQDVTLGGLEPMKQLKTLIREQGVFFDNAFVHTPICCPSRSSYLTGKSRHIIQS